MKHHLKGRVISRSRNLSSTGELIFPDGTGSEVRRTSLLHVYRNDLLPGDLLGELRQVGLNGLHLRGKDFSLLSPKNPRCETIGWIPVG